MTEPAALRIYCDFNKAIDYDVFSLNTVGSRDDLAKAGASLHVGMHLTVYDEDADDRGRPTWLVADAVVEVFPSGLAARVKPGTWRHELRDS